MDFCEFWLTNNTRAYTAIHFILAKSYTSSSSILWCWVVAQSSSGCCSIVASCWTGWPRTPNTPASICVQKIFSNQMNYKNFWSLLRIGWYREQHNTAAHDTWKFHFHVKHVHKSNKIYLISAKLKTVVQNFLSFLC